MLKFVGLAALVLAIAAAAIVTYAATRPDRFVVQRSATIDAPPAKIFPYLDNFRQFALWSPFEKMDPAMKREFSGAESGKGASYAWAGNNQAGAGSMEITGVTPDRQVEIDLAFTKPFKTRNAVVFSLEPAGAQTRVTWTMSGPLPLIARVMQLFFNMDKEIGGHFEAGLASLKALAEK